MRFYSHVPGRPLDEFIGMFWLYEGYTEPHDKERLLPDGSMELVVNLAEDRIRDYHPGQTEKFQMLRGSVMVGAHSEFFVIDTAEQFNVAGVHFKPGGAFPFFGPPANELQNQMVSLADLWGALAGQLRERLLEAGTPGEKFRVFAEILLARAAQRLGRHPAVDYALGQFRSAAQTSTVAGVTGRIGLSAKRFIDVFSGEVGLTPKLYCRVRRFQRAVRLADRGRTIDWAALAADCGYFDQAHFIHDFRAFSGINPSTYIAQRTPHLNHVPLID